MFVLESSTNLDARLAVSLFVPRIDMRNGVFSSEKNKEVMLNENVGDEDAKGIYALDILESALTWLRTLWNTRIMLYPMQIDAYSKLSLSSRFHLCYRRA